MHVRVESIERDRALIARALERLATHLADPITWDFNRETAARCRELAREYAGPSQLGTQREPIEQAIQQRGVRDEQKRIP